MTCVRIALAIAFVALSAGSARASSPADYFRGTWKCGAVRWSFTPLNSGSTWTKIVYGDPARPYGLAALGYVPGLHRFVYRDFHSDGSYADLTSPAPRDGKWNWTGPYYPIDGKSILRGHVIYVEKGPARYDRHFLQTVNGHDVDRGGDVCVRQAR